MSIEILALKLPEVMGNYRHLSHTVLSCIVSCVHTSEQDIWCWWRTNSKLHYAPSIDTKNNDLGWPWTAETSLL